MAGRENLPTFRLPQPSDRIEPVVIIDGVGRRWNLLPEAWRDRAPLCCGVMAYEVGGRTHIVACRELSAWASDDTAYCCRCFAKLVALPEGE